MPKIEFTNEDIVERRDEYALALKQEKQASHSVRSNWAKLIAVLDELLVWRKDHE